jgi:DUF4097 and DUF4098 domain-containing protein YvlB
LTTLLAGTACIDLIGADVNKYVEREEKRFSISGTPDVVLSTFDGSIEIRAWDKPEVEVIVEKRASSKEAAQEIEVRTEQNGDQVTVNVKAPKQTGFAIHFSRSAKLIVSMPTSSNVAAKSGDGSIDLSRITGRLDLRTGDGSIQGRDLAGDVKAHTGDGSIRLEGISGTIDVDTGDGSVMARGRLSGVQARSGDGSVTIHAETGSSPTGDWNLKTGDGSVTLELPDDFNGELDAHTGDGGIRMNDITLSNVTGTISKNTVRGRLGSGGPAVRLRTGDGSIHLKRSSPMKAESER